MQAEDRIQDLLRRNNELARIALEANEQWRQTTHKWRKAIILNFILLSVIAFQMLAMAFT
jgi:hypothetical protein